MATSLIIFFFLFKRKQIETPTNTNHKTVKKIHKTLKFHKFSTHIPQTPQVFFIFSANKQEKKKANQEDCTLCTKLDLRKKNPNACKKEKINKQVESTMMKLKNKIKKKK